MTYKCLIVDDEELARKLIGRHLSQLNDFEILASCGSAIEASNILQEEVVDLIFLDIEMPVLKGTDFLKNLLQKPSVIFTTAYRDYAIDGFNLNAVDYLLKPITFERFFKAIEKFKNQNRPLPEKTVLESPETKEDFVYIQKNRKHVKILFDRILYIESLKDYIRIHLENENHLIKHSISSFWGLLDERFVRTHRSYIVNKDKITAYTKHDIEIGKTEIPIGESYKSSVNENL
jgi:two-component system, LytTR family, response regulator